MIVVTGSRRAGTSMWMQVLEAAGLPVIGDKFPLDWGEALAPANPHGFYESTLREGIHYGTNPDPRSGEYLHPDETRMHAVKVFAEGLVRSDLSFLDRVLVTIRPWHEYAASIDRLFRLENEARGWSYADRPPRLPAALEWWAANFALVRDVAMRRYRVHLQPLEHVLSRPHEVIPRVLSWIADGAELEPTLHVEAAIAAVRASAATCADAPRSEIELEHAAVFDAFYTAVVEGTGLDSGLLARMNATHNELAPRLAEHAQAVLRWIAARPPSSADGPAAGPLALEAPAPSPRGGR